MVIPGATTKNRFENRASRGAWTLLIVCHAMNIAITTVFPVPVAIFNATRGSPSLCTWFSASRIRRTSGPCRPAASVR